MLENEGDCSAKKKRSRWDAEEPKIPIRVQNMLNELYSISKYETNFKHESALIVTSLEITLE